MAPLIVKNLPDGLYRKLKARAKSEHRSVAQEVTVLLTEALQAKAMPSILQLQGLDKELWRDIDAEAHVGQERAGGARDHVCRGLAVLKRMSV